LGVVGMSFFKEKEKKKNQQLELQP
jgi:hypothetical protein